MPRYTPGSFVIVRRSYRLNLSAWYTPYIYGTPQLGRFDVKLVLLPSVRRIRILPSSTAAIPARPRARIPAAPVLPATIAPVATQHATQKTPGTQAYTPGSFVIVRRSYRLNLSAWYTPYIYGTPQLGRFDVKLVLLPSVRRIRILPSSTAAIPARPRARIPAAPVLPATIAPVATQHATQKTPGTQAYTPGSFVIVRRSYRLNLSAWYTPYIYGTPQLGRFDVKLVLLPSVRRIRILPSSTAAIPARPRARIPAAPVLPATIAPVTTQHATQKTPGTQAIPLAASNQNTIPSVVGPPVIPVQQLGVPAASSAPLSVPAVLPAPRGPLNTPASNAMAALSAPAIPLQAVASPVPPTQPDQQGIPISIPAGLIPSFAPIQPAVGPPQTPQVAFAAPPETDNDPPMFEFQPPFENDYYGHNGSDPEKEDLWENVHFYGPGVYRLIDPLCPDLTKEQAQAAQKVWDTVQAYMRDIV